MIQPVNSADLTDNGFLLITVPVWIFLIFLSCGFWLNDTHSF